MRNVFRGVSSAAFFVAIIISVASCGLLKKKGDSADAAPEAAVAEVVDAAPVPPPVVTPTASNENDIARFPDEVKLDNVAATTQRAYNVREAPPAGTVVMSLPKGSAITQLSQRDKYFLVLFDDPKGSGNKLMGWLHADAFSAVVVVDAGVSTLKCPTGEIALFSDTPFCGKLCQKDTDCPGGQACKGQANKLTNGKAGDVVTVCTVFHAHDAGAPTPVDAGAKVDAAAPAKDAGPAVVDAGLPKLADVVAPVGGKCPVTYQLVAKTGKCHRPCPIVSACGANSFCIKCDADQKRVCGESRDQCK